MFVIELMCGHAYTISDRPRIDEPCKEGCGTQCLVNEWPEQWHSGCTECSYHRRHGYGKKYATNAGNLHTARTGHRTTVRFYSEIPARIRTQLRVTAPTDLYPWNLPKDAPPPF